MTHSSLGIQFHDPKQAIYAGWRRSIGMETLMNRLAVREQIPKEIGGSGFSVLAGTV